MVTLEQALDMAEALDSVPTYDVGGYTVNGWSEYDGDPCFDAANMIRKQAEELELLRSVTSDRLHALFQMEMTAERNFQNTK